MSKKIFETLFVIMAMLTIILKKSSCFEILVVGILFAILITLDKMVEKKIEKKK